MDRTRNRIASMIVSGTAYAISQQTRTVHNINDNYKCDSFTGC